MLQVTDQREEHQAEIGGGGAWRVPVGILVVYGAAPGRSLVLWSEAVEGLLVLPHCYAWD